MNAIAIKSRLLFIVVLLTILSSVQVIHAQGNAPACAEAIPQWVRDRQQYETSYVYVPATMEAQSGQFVAHIPQWVKDRQQYETSYVYVPAQVELQPGQFVVHIPQWVKDRQQYETSYVYKPPSAMLVFADAQCGLTLATAS